MTPWKGLVYASEFICLQADDSTLNTKRTGTISNMLLRILISRHHNRTSKMVHRLRTRFRTRMDASSSLPRFLRANQRNNPTQFGTLLELLPFDLLWGIAGGNFGACLQHAVLQVQHLGEGVVEEWSRELDVAGRGREADLQLARRLPPVLRLGLSNWLSIAPS